MPNIDFDMKAIGSILKSRKLNVPRYQRSYAWEKKHVLDLLMDLEEAIKEKREEYFLGSIVLLGQREDMEVVDGQQRLATVAIIISAMRNFLIEEGDAPRADDIEKDFLMSKNRRTQDIEPNLRLNSENHDFFEHQILQKTDKKSLKSIKPSSDSNNKIKDAAQQAHAFIKKRFSPLTDPAGEVIDWIEYLENNAKVMEVVVPTGADAFTIFETLNDRGLDLAISDLLKNHIFSKSGRRIDEAQDKWAEMMGALSVVDADKAIVAYLRHVWSTRYGLIRERELYQKIRESVRNPQTAIDILQIFSASADRYGKILNPTEERWKPFGQEARQSMDTLNLLKMTQVRPLILSILEKFKPTDVKIAMKLTVSWAVRLTISGRLGSSELENFYAGVAKDISNDKVKTPSDLRAAAQKVVPNDIEFQSAFELAKVKQPQIARYFLRSLEIDPTSKKPEFVPNEKADDIDLEHVMPKNAEAAWGEDPLVVETHLNRLGNIALFRKSDNSNLGDSTFDKKKPFYSKSKFKFTHALSKYKNWGPLEIERRQKELAKVALTVWSLK